MIILGVETSCDETALALIEAGGDISAPNFKIINTALNSQTEIHAQYGGVFPTLAKREHAKNIMPLFTGLLAKNNSGKVLAKVSEPVILTEEQQNKIRELFKKENNLAEIFIKQIQQIPKPAIDLIAVTSGPGLEPALWVGINFAKALSEIWQIPLLPTNHMEGHILSVLKSAPNKIDFPAIALLISGGHTEIVLVKNFGDYQILGQTRDDAVGEAFDKVARLLDLPYPGGPEIAKLAELAEKEAPETVAANDTAITATAAEKTDAHAKIKLPRPMLNTNDFDFSFSGLKTAVLYLIKNLKAENLYTDQIKKNIAKEFQDAVIEVLYKKTVSAIEKYQAKSLIIGGGVIANRQIRQTFQKLEKENSAKLNSRFFKVYVPEMSLATDNAVMIAFAGYISQFRKTPAINPEIQAEGNLKL